MLNQVLNKLNSEHLYQHGFQLELSGTEVFIDDFWLKIPLDWILTEELRDAEKAIYLARDLENCEIGDYLKEEAIRASALRIIIIREKLIEIESRKQEIDRLELAVKTIMGGKSNV